MGNNTHLVCLCESFVYIVPFIVHGYYIVGLSEFYLFGSESLLYTSVFIYVYCVLFCKVNWDFSLQKNKKSIKIEINVPTF